MALFFRNQKRNLTMSAKDKLISLLAYTDQLAKLTQRANFSTKNYRTLLYTEQQLHNRIGIEHNVEETDGLAWLKIQRLQRRDPPAPEEAIREWVEPHRDTTKKPKVSDSILKTISKEDVEQLVAKKRVSADDVMESSSPDANLVDVRLLLKNQKDVKRKIDDYLAGPWAEWHKQESLKIETIEIYEKFFNLCQMIESSGADNPLEVVWGLGFALWKADHKTLQHPLIESLVELRIDPLSKAILVMAREREPQFYLSPFTELGLETVRSTQVRMRECYDATFRVDEHTGTAKAEEFSPFNSVSFEPVLETAASLLTGDGQYWPSVNNDPSSREHPPITDTLTVTDTWAIYARGRSSNILIDDIDKLRQKVAAARDDELPPVGTEIVRDPNSDRDTQHGGGTTGNGKSGGGKSEGLIDESEVLFPKPSNDAQLKIVKRLERENGVVVQGPPGTGKTHTIANIVCHYLATGRSVLVVSKGEPALAVLRDQIPEGIRDLSISLLTSEREGLKQLEGAITFMSNDVLSKDVELLNRTCRTDEERVRQLQRRLQAIDHQMRKLAESQLAKIPESLQVADKDWPAEAAQLLAVNRDRYQWLEDELGFGGEFDQKFTQSDISTLKEARRRLGDDLGYSQVAIPHRNDLPTPRVIANAHVNLLQASSLGSEPPSGSLLTILGRDEETERSGRRLADDLKLFLQALDYATSASWLSELYAGWISKGASKDDDASVESAVVDLETLAEIRRAFRKRPIALPSQNVSSTALRQALERGKRNGKPFRVVSFGSNDIKLYLQATTIAGKPASSAGDWAYILEYVSFRDQITQFAYRWNALAEDFNVPGISVDPNEMERWIGSQQKALSVVLAAAIRFHQTADNDVRILFAGNVDRKRLLLDSKRLTEVAEAVDRFLHRQNLGESRFVIEKARTDLHGRQGPVFDAARKLLDQVGRSDHSANEIEQRWATFLAEIDHLGSQRDAFLVVTEVAGKVEASGAPRWASRLRTVPAKDNADTVLRDNWNEAWRFRRLELFLKSIDARDELTVLSKNRIDTLKSLEIATQELVKTRTYLGLHKRMSSGGRLSALRQFLSAIRNIGQGTGKRATRYRGDAQKAMAQCMEAVPCWIMPTWRVSESLPPTLGSFDLVIIDEASQSDIMALPALMRGKKVLVVGDDRQVSPSNVGFEERKLLQLRHGFLRDQPFAALLMPGTSFYELAQAVFPAGTVMLNEHFRCVEPIIRFSLQFYPEKFVPLRIPKPSERLDPPLIDVYIKNATRKGKVNEAEVIAIVDEIDRLVSDPAYDKRTIGVVCLVGHEQSNVIQKRLLARIGEEKFLKHGITCGDPPTFQGKERDIIFLSMVAVPGNATAQTTRQFEQRFNVALSRARDRMYLYRSVTEKDLPNANDLKQKVISHFKSPMPVAMENTKEMIDLCESDFEKEVFQRLARLDYRVTPQVAVGHYRIDLVVDGGDDRRLAIELDGDKYHGPDRWFEDYARQKTLERMNWQFWRCWGSSFSLDPDGCMADLVNALNERGIQPIGKSAGLRQFTEHRILDAVDLLAGPNIDQIENDDETDNFETSEVETVAVGDSITLIFDDEPSRVYQLILDDSETDLINGIVSVHSPLGQQLISGQADEEIQVTWNDRRRKCTIQAIKKREIATA